MLTASKNLVRRRAIAAAIFAGAIISSQNTAWSKNNAELEGNGTLIQQIASDTEITPEVRAYHLLQLADHYISDKTKATAEQLFDGSGTQKVKGWRLGIFRVETQLVWWAERLSTENPRSADLRTGSNRFELADAAAKQAVIQLEQSSNEFMKLNLYYIASMLFRKIGDVQETQKCNDILERAFLLCEHDSSIKEECVKAVASVLNLKAYGILPVVIPVNQSPQEQVKFTNPFSDEKFKSAEQLRLRAIAIADRLDDKSDTRRRVHRDMYFWYAQLGKIKLADIQKQNVFDLVGRHDERILYPYGGTCGTLVWWQEPSVDSARFLCGMG